MEIQFSPNNNIVKLCLLGMGWEDKGELKKASEVFLRAWSEAVDDFEKYLAAYYVARQQENNYDKLKWLKISLRFALKIDNFSVRSSYALIYLNIADCYKELGEIEKARENYELSKSYEAGPIDSGPFYHGTKADLQPGDFLVAGKVSNYNSELKMNHIYFTALVNGAGLSAALAKGEGKERVYIVKPTGNFENDPNVTDKKFPGNPTRSYRTKEPLEIIGEVTDWEHQTVADIKQWNKKLEKNKGDIIN